jgi:uncharacterized membrane protein
MSDTFETHPSKPGLERRLGLIRAGAVTTLILLIALGMAWELWLAPVRPGGTLLALKVLPLCIPLAGILKQRMYTYRWVTLMVWIYFTEGVVRATSDRAPSSYLAMLEVALCVILFVLCALHVRLRIGPRKKRSTASVNTPA